MVQYLTLASIGHLLLLRERVHGRVEGRPQERQGDLHLRHGRRVQRRLRPRSHEYVISSLESPIECTAMRVSVIVPPVIIVMAEVVTATVFVHLSLFLCLSVCNRLLACISISVSICDVFCRRSRDADVPERRLLHR